MVAAERQPQQVRHDQADETNHAGQTHRRRRRSGYVSVFDVNNTNRMTSGRGAIPTGTLSSVDYLSAAMAQSGIVMCVC